MIPINELRQGNYYRCKVYNGNNDVILPFTWQEYKYAHLFEPIPLTEEVLRAAGFELQKDRDMYWISLNNYSIILHIEKGGRFSYFINSIQIMYVDTLHQLQNLVHALTGRELEVSLTGIGNSPIRDNK